MNDLTNIATPVSTELRERFGRVGVLMGGTSAERKVSLDSGAAVLTALLNANVDAIGIDLYGNDSSKNVIEQITSQNLDRAFIVLHGVGGEDGQIQSLLKFLSLPFTGSGVQASAIAMDKLLSKQLWKGIGLATANFARLTEASDWQQIISELGGKVMVKPAHEGSSLGMSIAKSADELKAAFLNAAKFDQSVIAEQFIVGGEYTVAILNDKALPPIKLEAQSEFYDFHAKYVANDTRYICPCGLPADKEDQLKSLALQAYQSVNCKGWARVDVMADQEGNFYLLEINTVPGMTSHSLVPMAAKADGLTFEQLVVAILLGTDLATDLHTAGAQQ